MAHGPDTEELLYRFANCEDGMIEISNLNITSIPPIPINVISLNCSNTEITKLPNLPKYLEYLDCSNTKISKMQNLPKTLQYLNCSNTEIKKFPRLGENLEWLVCQNCPLILPIKEGEDLNSYKIRNNAFQNNQTVKNDYDSYKEELGMIMECIKRLEKLAEKHSMNVMYS